MWVGKGVAAACPGALMVSLCFASAWVSGVLCAVCVRGTGVPIRRAEPVSQNLSPTPCPPPHKEIYLFHTPMGLHHAPERHFPSHPDQIRTHFWESMPDRHPWAPYIPSPPTQKTSH